MGLEILLEAAEFVEIENKPRAVSACDYEYPDGTLSFYFVDLHPCPIIPGNDFDSDQNVVFTTSRFCSGQRGSDSDLREEQELLDALNGAATDYLFNLVRPPSTQPPSSPESGNQQPRLRKFQNKKEQERRSKLKDCFELLRRQLPLPSSPSRKVSNLVILKSSIHLIQRLKSREQEYGIEMEKLTLQNIALQEKLSILKKMEEKPEDVVPDNIR